MPAQGPPEDSSPPEFNHREVPLPGGYRFLGTCGFGGFGILAKVENASTGGISVLKIPHSITILDPSRLKRFMREVELHSRLNLPGVAKAVSRSADGEMPFLELEYYPLGNLAAWLAKAGGRLPTREVLRCGLQFTSILAGIQEQGIIHRDIRPENLLVFRESPLEIHLTDFGMATTTEAPGGLTRLADCDGFLAPEVTGALEHPACRASDVWSAGMILAFLARGPSKYLEVLEACCKPPEASVESSRLLKCILHCVSVHPRDRYQDARALAGDLKMVLDGKAPAVAERHNAMRARRRFMRGTAAIGCGSAGMAYFGARWFYPRAEQVKAEKVSDLPGVAREIIRTARDGTIDEARAIWLLHREDLRRSPFLAAAAERATNPSRLFMDWPGEELPEIYHVAFSPNGRVLAAACQDGALRAWTWPDRKPLFRAMGIGCEINMVFFSPDGGAVWTIADDGTARVHDVANGGRPRREVKASSLPLPAGCVYGDSLFVGDTDGVIARVNPESGTVRWSARVGSGRVESVAAKADGTKLAIGFVDGLVVIVDSASGDVMGQFRLVPDIRWIDWLQNDLVVAGSSNRVGLHNGADFRQVWFWSNGGNETRSVSILKRPDESSLVVAGADRGKVILLDPAGGDVERAYCGAPEIVRHVRPCPGEDQLIAVGRNGPPRIFDATRSQETRNWTHPGGGWVDAAWTDSSTVLALDTGGVVWRLTPGEAEPKAPFPKPTVDAVALGFAPEGVVLWKCGGDIAVTTRETKSPARFPAGTGLGGFHIDKDFCAVVLKGKIALATAADGFSRFVPTRFEQERIEAVRLVRDQATLVVTCEDTIIIYRLPEMIELGRFPRSEYFGALCAHVPDSGTLCIGRRTGDVRVLDLKTMSFRHGIQVSSQAVTAINSHEASGLLFTASLQGRIFTHGLPSGTVGPEWNIPASQIVSKLAVSPHGEHLMSLSESGRKSMITIWC